VSNILDRCNVLTARLAKLRELEAQRLQAEQLEGRRRELEEQRQLLMVATARAQVLTARGHLQAASWPDVSASRAALVRVANRFRQDPAQIASGRDYKALLEFCGRAVQSLESAVMAAWTKIQAEADPVSEQLLQQLSQVPGQVRAVEQVRSMRAHLRALGATPPANLADYDAFQEAANALASVWTGLDHRDLPDSVIQFLRAAQAPGGAPVSLWTGEVRAWLEEHGMLEQVRLQLRPGR